MCHASNSVRVGEASDQQLDKSETHVPYGVNSPHQWETVVSVPNRQLDSRIGGVFVSHPKKGFEDRETHIVRHFADLGVPFKFVGKFLKNELTAEVRHQYNISPNVPAGRASNAINHLAAYEEIVQRQLQCAIVFEDDVILSSKFHSVLTTALDELRTVEGPFCVFLANSMNRYVHRSEIRKGQHLYRAHVGKCPDAYLISQEAARLRLQFVTQHGINYSHERTYSIADRAEGIKIFWLEPTIVVPGSTSGRFETSLNRRWRWKPARKVRWYWKMLFTRFRGVRLHVPDGAKMTKSD